MRHSSDRHQRQCQIPTVSRCVDVIRLRGDVLSPLRSTWGQPSIDGRRTQSFQAGETFFLEQREELRNGKTGQERLRVHPLDSVRNRRGARKNHLRHSFRSRIARRLAQLLDRDRCPGTRRFRAVLVTTTQIYDKRPIAALPFLTEQSATLPPGSSTALICRPVRRGEASGFNNMRFSS